MGTRTLIDLAGGGILLPRIHRIGIHHLTDGSLLHKNYLCERSHNLI